MFWKLWPSCTLSTYASAELWWGGSGKTFGMAYFQVNLVLPGMQRSRTIKISWCDFCWCRDVTVRGVVKSVYLGFGCKFFPSLFSTITAALVF